MKKLKLRVETLRTLTNTDLTKIGGGIESAAQCAAHGANTRWCVAGESGAQC